MTLNTPFSGMVINWLILITLGVIWGASFLGVELALTGFGPITLAAGRVSAAALILLVIALVYGDGLPGFKQQPTVASGFIALAWRYSQMPFPFACYHGVSRL